MQLVSRTCTRGPGAVALVRTLPKGQAFSLIEGGQRWKVRMPLPDSRHDAEMPASLGQVAEEMRRDYATGEHWWVTEPVPRAPASGWAAAQGPAVVAPAALGGASPPTVDERVPE